MKLSAAIGLLIFVGALAGVTLPFLLGQHETAGAQSRGMVFSQLELGGEIQFAVPPTVERMRLSSRLLVPEHEARDRSRRYDYGLSVSWLDREGQVVSSRVFHERSRVTWTTDSADLAQGVARTAEIPGDERWITDNRVTTIPLRELLPEGGVVKVSATASDYPVLVRGFARTLRRGTDLERAVLAPTRREIEQAVHGSGVPSFELLNARERRLLLSKQWRADHVPLIGDAPISRRVQFLPSEAERDPGDVRLMLRPRRSVALNLRGSVAIRISGGADIQNLHVRAVADHPDGEAPPTSQETKGEPLGLVGETTGRLFEVASTTPFSLLISNPSGSEIRFYASVDDVTEAQLFGQTLGVPLSRLLPPNAPAALRATLLIPETHRFTAYRVGPGLPEPVLIATPGFGSDDTLLIDVRALLDGPDDKKERTLTIVGRDAAGAEIYRSNATFAVEPSPYEEVQALPPQGARPHPSGLAAPALRSGPAPAAGGWLSEPIHLYAPGDLGVAQIELASPDALIATVRAPGMVHGDDSLYPLPNGVARMRYTKRPLTEWARLPPIAPERLREAGQALTVTANVRLEAPADLMQGDGTGQGARLYSSLEPSDRSRASGRVWLVRATSESDGSLYCRYRVSENKQRFTFDAKALHGELAGVLWSPTAGIGDPYAVRLDDTPWRQARVRQRVTRFKAVREPRHQTARFKGPNGATLWLRTHGGPEACRAPHRALAAHSVAPGRSITFPLNKTLPEQLVIFSGFGRQNASIEVTVDDATRVPVLGLLTSVTTMRRDMELPVTEARAFDLGSPAIREPVLGTAAIRLGADLPAGAHSITLTNHGKKAIYLRAATESSLTPTRGTDSPPRLVSRGEPASVGGSTQ